MWPTNYGGGYYSDYSSYDRNDHTPKAADPEPRRGDATKPKTKPKKWESGRWQPPGGRGGKRR